MIAAPTVLSKPIPTIDPICHLPISKADRETTEQLRQQFLSELAKLEKLVEESEVKHG